MGYKDWEKDHLKKFDATLFMVVNEESGCYEIWRKRLKYFNEPATWRELRHWLDIGKWGYMRVMEIRGPKGEPADPGPFVLEIMHTYDTARDPHCTQRYWTKCKEEREKNSAKAKEEIAEQIKYHQRGMVRDWEGQTPHGASIHVPRSAPV